MTSPVVSNEMYVILGATGNTGSIVADVLLSKGKKVRVVGRDLGRLQRFVDKGAEAFTADMSNVAVLTKAFSGARAHTCCCRRRNPRRTRSGTAMGSRTRRRNPACDTRCI